MPEYRTPKNLKPFFDTNTAYHDSTEHPIPSGRTPSDRSFWFAYDLDPEDQNISAGVYLFRIELYRENYLQHYAYHEIPLRIDRN